MALTLDAEARRAVARRRARGREPAIAVRVATMPARGTHTILSAEWSSRRDSGDLLPQQVEDATVYVDRRIARYARWHDVTISAQRLGPIDRLAVAQEPLVLLQLQRWERTHPGLLTAPAA